MQAVEEGDDPPKKMLNGELGGLAIWLNGPLRLTMSLTCPEPFGAPFGVIYGLPAPWLLQTACESCSADRRLSSDKGHRRPMPRRLLTCTRPVRARLRGRALSLGFLRIRRAIRRCTPVPIFSPMLPSDGAAPSWRAGPRLSHSFQDSTTLPSFHRSMLMPVTDARAHPGATREAPRVLDHPAPPSAQPTERKTP